MAEMAKVKDSYNCDALSLAAATAALEDQDYLRTTRARILTTLLHEMKRRGNVKYGLATLCVGVGQGEATIVEWIGA